MNLGLGTGEKLTVVSHTTSYSLSLGAGQTWSGQDDADVHGGGTKTLTVTGAGIAAFTSGIHISDSASAGGDAVEFADGGSKVYANSFAIDLGHATSGVATPGLSFKGATTFGAGAALTAVVGGDVVVAAGASLSFAGGPLSLSATGTNAPLVVGGGIADDGGPVTLQATGAIVVEAGATVNAGVGALVVAADVRADGAGDDGAGALSLAAGASLFAQDITLRGADVAVDAAAVVGRAVAGPAVSTFVPSTAGLLSPLGTAFDADGDLYVGNYSTTADGSISKITPTGQVSTFASGSSLIQATGLAFDSHGTLYIANWYSGAISKVAPDGTVANFVATGLNSIFSMAFGPNGDLYVAGESSDQILKVTPDGVVSTFIDRSAGLDGPFGLAFDADGVLYVSSRSGNTISKATADGVVSTFVSSGLNNPWGLAFDSRGDLYVANFGGSSISKVTADGVVATYLTGVNGPATLAFDSTGALYITNFSRNTVTKATAAVAATQAVTIRSSLGDRPMSLGGADDAVAGVNLTDAELARIVTSPTGVVTIGDAEQTGDLVLAGATLATTPGAVAAVVQSAAGGGRIVLDDTGGTALQGGAGGVTLTAGAGGIAALNPADDRAEIATTGAAVVLVTTGPIGVAGSPIQFAANANTAQQIVTVRGASSAHLDGLGALTLGNVEGGDANTALTVTAREGLVVAGGAVVNTGAGALSLAADVKADETGDDGVGTLHIGAGSAVYAATIALRGADIDVDASADVGSRSSLVSKDLAHSADGLSTPLGQAFDSAGNLYVANYGNNTISKITPAGVVSAFVAAGAGLHAPIGLAFDAGGVLFVANSAEGTISKVTPDGTVSLFVSSDSGLSNLRALAFDAAGDLYVACFLSDKVSRVTPDGVVSTFATGLDGATGLAFDAAGDLYVSNFSANTVSRVTPDGVASVFVDSTSGLTRPQGLAFDSGGRLIVANGDGAILQVTSNAVVSTLVPQSAGLYQPAFLAFDAGGRLYVTASGVVARLTTNVAPTSLASIRSSSPGRPMSLGAGDVQLKGVNLTNAELARIVTLATGEVVVGDHAQTGDVTLTGATIATTAGAATTVVQSAVGDGGIVLAPGATTALDGHGGAVTLIPGTGGLAADVPAAGSTFTTRGFTAAGLALNLGLPFAPEAGRTMTIVRNTGGPIVGEFTNLPDGEVVTLVGVDARSYEFLVSYAGGSGHDLTLTAMAAPAITSVGHATWLVGRAGSFAILTTGAPAAVLSMSGTLPDGVTFKADGKGAGTLKGTPAAGAGGSYQLTFTASNGATPDAVQTFTLTINQAPAVTSADHAAFVVGRSGSFTVTTSGYPVAGVAATGALPAGLTFVDNGDGTATLTGAPAAGSGGVYALTLAASNGAAPDAVQAFTLTVGQVSTFTSVDHATFVAGLASSFTIATSGFPAPALAATGSLPAGLSFVDNGDGTATLAGAPAAGSGGVYALTLAASNGVALDAVQAFTLTVGQASTFTSVDHATFVAERSGSFTVTTNGYPSAVVLQTGVLPAGLSFVDNGDGTATLAGAPAAGSGGVYALTLAASNGVAPDAVQSYSLTVDPGVTSTTTTLTSARDASLYGQGVLLTAIVQATGGGAQSLVGMVQFWDGGLLLGVVPVSGTGLASLQVATPTAWGQASLLVASLAAGEHSLAATYLGTDGYRSSTSAVMVQEVAVNQAVAKLDYAVVPPSGPSQTHRSVVFTVLVDSAGAARPISEGTVSIRQSNGRIVATKAVENGRATFDRLLCQAFQKSFYAVYSGTANLTGARSNSIRVTLTPSASRSRSTPTPIVPKVTAHAPGATIARAFHSSRSGGRMR
nr:Ig-like domain repeat protein [Paludisphaera mucosa]